MAEDLRPLQKICPFYDEMPFSINHFCPTPTRNVPTALHTLFLFINVVSLLTGAMGRVIACRCLVAPLALGLSLLLCLPTATTQEQDIPILVLLPGQAPNKYIFPFGLEMCGSAGNGLRICYVRFLYAGFLILDQFHRSRAQTPPKWRPQYGKFIYLPSSSEITILSKFL